MTGVEHSTVTQVVFWIMAATAIAGAAAVVLLRDVFKAALFLAASFFAIAGVFVLLRAEFLAAVQILIYVGAVAILIIFAIMLVRDVPGGNTSNRIAPIAGIVALIVVGTVVLAAVRGNYTSQDAAAQANANIQAGLVGSYTTTGGTLNGHVQPSQQQVHAAPANVPNTETGVFVNSTGVIGGLLIRDFVLPFEAVSVVLLAAMVGALALIRERQTQ